MAEGDTILEPGKAKPELSKISRRGLLKGIAGIGLSLAIGQVPESPSLEKQIEGRFGIIIDNSPGKGKSGNPKIKWDSPRLSLVNDVLGNLPQSFYKPRISNEGREIPLKIALLNPRDLPLSQCVCGQDIPGTVGSQPEIEFTSNILNFRNKDEIQVSKTTIVHELTHYAIEPRMPELREKICGRLGLNSEEELQQEFDFAHYVFDPTFSIGSNEIKYAGQNFSEFFAVTGQFYAMGRNKFLSLYVPQIGEDKSIKLYQSMKDEVFQGNEYRDFILQNQKP